MKKNKRKTKIMTFSPNLNIEYVNFFIAPELKDINVYKIIIVITDTEFETIIADFTDRMRKISQIQILQKWIVNGAQFTFVSHLNGLTFYKRTMEITNQLKNIYKCNVNIY